MKWAILVLIILITVGCDGIGVGGAYPSIYTKSVNECGCDGVMYMMKNPNQFAQKVTLVRSRQSGTSAEKRKTLTLIIQPRAQKKIGCSEINLYITGRSEYCDTHQSFYIKKSRDIKKRD